jgi:uncharacterized protein (DUF362 family)
VLASTPLDIGMTPTVSLLRARSYAIDEVRTHLEALLAPLGGMSAVVKPGDRVLLKPNMLTGARPTKECVTRPEIVYCVAELVKAAGGQPFLGDSPAFRQCPWGCQSLRLFALDGKSRPSHSGTPRQALCHCC